MTMMINCGVCGREIYADKMYCSECELNDPGLFADRFMRMLADGMGYKLRRKSK